MNVKLFSLAGPRRSLAALGCAGTALLLGWTGAAQSFDYADAPAPYPTTLKDNGARHVVGGPLLGSIVDVEEDGQPDPSALGLAMTGLASLEFSRRKPR